MSDNLEKETNPYKQIHNKFVDKSTWKSNRVHQSLEIFQRTFKLGLLNSIIENVKKVYLTREQMTCLKESSDNPDIVIKRQTKALQWW